jgi:hypothetical protein
MDRTHVAALPSLWEGEAREVTNDRQEAAQRPETEKPVSLEKNKSKISIGMREN